MHLKIILLNQGFELYFSETIIKVVEIKKLIIKVHIHVSLKLTKINSHFLPQNFTQIKDFRGNLQLQKDDLLNDQ